MPWYFYSLLTLLSFSGMFLCVKWLAQKGFGAKQTLLFLFAFAFLGFLIISVPSLKNDYQSNYFPVFLLIMVPVGLFAILGNLMEFEAIKRAPNPGFPIAIRNGNILLIALLAILFFNNSFSFLKFLGIISIILGMAMLATGQNNRLVPEAKRGLPWLHLAFIAFFSFTLAILGIKKITLLGFSSLTINFFSFAINLIGFAILCRKEIRSYFQDRERLKVFIPVVFAAAAFSFLGNFLNVIGLGLAPNPAYNEAIKNTNVLLVTLFSIPLFGLSIDKKKIIGVIFIALGIPILII